MSITIETAVLAKAMKSAAAVTEACNIVPILSNARLMADGDELEIVTSNLDVEFRQRLPLASGGALAVTVDAKRLSTLAAAAPRGSQLAIEAEEGRAIVKSGRSRWTMPVLPVDDFPTIIFEGESELRIGAAGLSEAFARVLWSVSDEPTRHYLNGPLLHGDQGTSVLAATNGHCLMRVPLPNAHPEAAPDVILGPKWCRIVESLAKDAGEGDTVILRWSDKVIRATLSSKTGASPIEVTGKVIDGTFPDYRRVIPELIDSPMTVDPVALKEALRRVQVLASEKTRAVKLERGAGVLELTCQSPDTGMGREEVPADCEAGFSSGFNARYLTDMLTAIGGDSVTIHHVNAGAQARFGRVVDDGAIGVVMPVRI